MAPLCNQRAGGENDLDKLLASIRLLHSVRRCALEAWHGVDCVCVVMHLISYRPSACPAT